MKPLPPFTAVVHVASDHQATEQTHVALANGAGGVFLIDHVASFPKLLVTYRRVREQFPDAWIGLNFLDLTLDPAEAVARLPWDADALWMDNMDDLDATRADVPRQSRLFGGAAFKYQATTEPDAAAARGVASRLRAEDVVTTSGPGTGQAATVEKVRGMKVALGNRPLALASGVTPANVAEYKAYVNCFLVATGISTSFHKFDPAKVRDLADQLRP